MFFKSRFYTNHDFSLSKFTELRFCKTDPGFHMWQGTTQLKSFIHDVAYGNGTYVAVDDGGRIAYLQE